VEGGIYIAVSGRWDIYSGEWKVDKYSGEWKGGYIQR
jgi:hypothetical protein